MGEIKLRLQQQEIRNGCVHIFIATWHHQNIPDKDITFDGWTDVNLLNLITISNNHLKVGHTKLQSTD